MRSWQERFGSLGVEVMVADVAPSSIVVDVRQRTIVLAPSLTVLAAERTLDRLYRWWERQPENISGECCSLVSR
jgi:hypothetical protein